MRFEHAPAADYSDLAGGNVLYSAPGYPGFPARLAIELFERARRLTGRDRVSVWDPMCGAGGLVTTLGLARPGAIERIVASDVSADAIALARKNLDLPTDDGLSERAGSLAARSPARAAAAERLRLRRAGLEPIPTRLAVLDATQLDHAAPVGVQRIDVVVTDLPYGHQTGWVSESAHPAAAMLGQLRTLLPTHAAIVVCSTVRDDMGAPDRATRLQARQTSDQVLERYGTV